MTVSPSRLANSILYIGRNRRRGAPFEVAITGASTGPDDAVFGQYEAAGVTWWLEHIHGRRAPYAQLLSRVEAGPPRP